MYRKVQYGVVEILNIVGSLALFLYGMKLMSESLQKLIGGTLKRFLPAMTANRINQIFAGTFFTAAILSSSAASVMVVSSVNAGVISLSQSVGIILGANIGATFSAWMVSLLGFKFGVDLIAVSVLAIGVPLVFSSIEKRKAWGGVFVGFSLLFIGTAILKDAIPSSRMVEIVIDFVSQSAVWGFGAVVVFLLVGMLLALITRSSSAIFVFTLALCSQGWIPFALATAMILGANIGTAIVTNYIASSGNVSARRSARVHLIYNVFATCLMLLVYSIVKIDGVEMLFAGMDVAVALPLFYTSFNLLVAAILIWFSPQIVASLVKFGFRPHEEEDFRLKYISMGLLHTSEMSLLQAKKEVGAYGERVVQMFGMVRELFQLSYNDEFESLYSRIAYYEENSDKLEVEIAAYLRRITTTDLSSLSQRRMMGMYKVISNLESIADCNYNIAKTIKRKREKRVMLDDEMRSNINILFDLISESLGIMQKNLEIGYAGVDLGSANEIEDKINQFRSVMKSEHAIYLESRRYSYETSVFYSDLFSEAERLGDYCNYVAENIAEVNVD